MGREGASTVTVCTREQCTTGLPEGLGCFRQRILVFIITKLVAKQYVISFGSHDHIRNVLLRSCDLQVTEELEQMMASLGMVDLGDTLEVAEELLQQHNQCVERVKVIACSVLQ